MYTHTYIHVHVPVQTHAYNLGVTPYFLSLSHSNGLPLLNITSSNSPTCSLLSSHPHPSLSPFFSSPPSSLSFEIMPVWFLRQEEEPRGIIHYLYIPGRPEDFFFLFLLLTVKLKYNEANFKCGCKKEIVSLFYDHVLAPLKKKIPSFIFSLLKEMM